MADSRDIDLYTYRLDIVDIFYSFDVGAGFHTVSTIFQLCNSTNQFLANRPSLLQTEVCWEHFVIYSAGSLGLEPMTFWLEVWTSTLTIF